MIGEELFKTKSLEPVKSLKFRGKMFDFIQTFRLRRIITAMQAIKCSWAQIYEAKPKNCSRSTREELVCQRKRSGKNY